MSVTFRWALVTAIAPIAWGSTYVVTNQWLPADSPFWGAAIRALPAGLLLMLFARAIPRGSWWWKSLVLGTLNVGAFFLLVYLAAQLLESSVASVIMAAAPAPMILMAWLMVSERPSSRVVIGALVGLFGVPLVVDLSSGNVNPYGVAASVSAMLMSSLGYSLAKRWTGQVPVLASTSWQLIAGGLMLLIAAVLFDGAPPQLTTSSALGFVYLFVVATAIANLAWFTGLSKLPAGMVAVIGLLNPVAGVALGIAIAGETLSITQAIGIAVVLLGVVIAQTGRAKNRSLDPATQLGSAPSGQSTSPAPSTHRMPTEREPIGAGARLS